MTTIEFETPALPAADAEALQKGAAAGTAWTAFAPLAKVDEARQEVYGVLAEEATDKVGEIFDYESSKPLFVAWNEIFKAATADAVGGPSLGNVRAMHQPDRAAGKLIRVEYDDVAKRILVVAKIVDPIDWEKCRQGVYTGFSIGGRYQKRWADAATGLVRYTADPNEGSLVDNPCIPGARFLALKLDGSEELRKFVEAAPADATAPDAAPPEPALTKDGGDGDMPADPAGVDAAAAVATPEGAAVEELADAAADHDPTVAVPVDTVQRLHNLVVAMGARCSGTNTASPVVAALEAAAWGGPGATAAALEAVLGADGAAPIPSDPYSYVLTELHSILVALGATCGTCATDKATPAGDLAKAGARHSAADQAHIQAIHAHAMALGAQAATPDADADKATPVGALAKDAPAPEPPAPAALRVTPAPAEDSPALAKALAVIATQSTQLEQLAVRLAKLEAEPAPGGPALNAEGLYAAAKAIGATSLPGEGTPSGADSVSLLKGWIARAEDPETRRVLEERLRLELLRAQERGPR